VKDTNDENLVTKIFLKKTNSEKFSLIAILAIISTGFLIRLYYNPHDIPVNFDGLLYFWYAIDTNLLGAFPSNIPINNNGWPLFLSIFFSFVKSENFLDYMFLQRLISIIISTCTIFIIYLICKEFFLEKYALVGSILFAFEPRVILNSVLGISDAFYLFLGSLALLIILRYHQKIWYLPFILSAFTIIVRVEGIFVFVGLSVVYFLKSQKNKILKYLIGIIIFSLIILSFSILRIDATGTDGISSKFTGSPKEIEMYSERNPGINLIQEGVVNFIKFFGWVLIPLFIIFVPTGFFIAIRDKEKFPILFSLIITFSIPPLYAMIIQAYDTRFFIMLYPIFCVFSLYSIKFIDKKINKKNIFLIVLIIGIILSSGIFLEMKKIDIENKKEEIKIAEVIVDHTKGINQYFPESSYIPIIGMQNLEKFPILSSEFESIGELGYCLNVHHCKYMIPIHQSSLEHFIIDNQNNELTHIIVDENKRLVFLNDIFENEQNYPFLIKEYDSKENGFKYHVKIFRINYNEFNEFYKNSLNEN